MPSHVTAVRPAAAAEALAHFDSALRFETDCWDVHDSLRTGAADFVLLDVRSPELFARGHVPGAVNLPFTDNLAPTSRFLDAADLQRRWEPVLQKAKLAPVVAMCGSGITACHNLVALELAGYRGARLYAGSFSEWIADPARPVATEESA